MPSYLSQPLWEKANLALFNAINNLSDSAEETELHRAKIAEFIVAHSTLGKNNVHVLFVGDEAEKAFPQLPANVKVTKAIHPSGTNISHVSRRGRYYNNWIKCEGLNDFRIFK